jgi:uncharacterized protein (DUF2062 family)
MKIINPKKLKYIYIRFIRQSGSSEEIARSAAVGLFVGFAMPIGTQMPVALLFAYIFKAKKILSLIFTLPTNLYTIIFIYPAQCWVGGKICGISLSFRELRKTFSVLLSDFKMESFLDFSGDMLISFFAGGLLFGTIFAIIGYFTVYGMIESYKKRSERKLARRLISRHDN